MTATDRTYWLNLSEKVKAGDKKAFEELYDKYSAALYGVVLRILGDDDEANDVLQESFVKIWRKIASFNPDKGTLFTWMLNIARNTSIDRLRKSKKIQKVEIQTLDYSVSDSNQPVTTQNIDTIGLKDLLKQLSPEQRQMVDYLYFKGYTHQEVSDELNLPLGTVKSRIRSAMKLLRDIVNMLLLWI